LLRRCGFLRMRVASFLVDIDRLGCITGDGGCIGAMGADAFALAGAVITAGCLGAGAWTLGATAPGTLAGAVITTGTLGAGAIILAGLWLL
jgi:hypothetical protein